MENELHQELTGLHRKINHLNEELRHANEQHQDLSHANAHLLWASSITAQNLAEVLANNPPTVSPACLGAGCKHVDTSQKARVSVFCPLVLQAPLSCLIYVVYLLISLYHASDLTLSCVNLSCVNLSISLFIYLFMGCESA